MDPDERMDAKTALKHRWLSKEYKLSDRRPDEALMRKVEDSLLAYKYTSALKKVALNVIARKSTPREIFQLRKAFGQYDIENDGTISFEEFKEALKQSNYSDKELEEIFSSIEVNAIGHIMYTGKSSCINDSSIIQRSIQLPHTFTTEFLAATLEVKGCVEEERIADAFDRLDNDESGYISPQDLRELLVGYSEKEIQALIAEADTDHDGQISFEEFKKIFNKRTETFAAKALSLDQELPAAEAPAADKKTPVVR
jgi:Ca2+-binding EF-hand superfamily protein